jgi:hypothetical protein
MKEKLNAVGELGNPAHTTKQTCDNRWAHHHTHYCECHKHVHFQLDK